MDDNTVIEADFAPTPESRQLRDREARELLAALAQVAPIEGLNDLVKKKTSRKHLPTLIEWLSNKARHPHTRDMIARGLTERKAGAEVFAALRDAFVREPNPAVRWTLGNALAVVAEDAEQFATLSALAREPRYGIGRQMLVLSLAEAPDPDPYVDLLVDLLEDPDVRGHAVKALASIGTPAAIRAVADCQNDPVPWIRSAARKARPDSNTT